MKKKEKTVCQIIRFRGKIEAFFVSIDEFDTSNFFQVFFLNLKYYITCKMM